MSATTDSEAKSALDWQKQPGVTNLLQILALLSNRPQDEITRRMAGQNQLRRAKKGVADKVSQLLINLQRDF